MNSISHDQFSKTPRTERLFGGIEGYYRQHAAIYDLTRWTFLFGRAALIQRLVNEAWSSPPQRIVEIGCGTGINLARLAKAFPTASLVGVDLSDDMLALAKQNLAFCANRLHLKHQAYSGPIQKDSFDLVVFSYCLSMFNPGWAEAMASGREDLAPGGRLAIVDFHGSPSRYFRAWMGLNHVLLDRHLFPEFQRLFPKNTSTVRRGWGGLWSYFLAIGNK